MKHFATPLVLLFPLVALNGMAEVATGNLAQQKAQSSSVKDFGAQMVKDQSAANEKLKALAQSKTLRCPPTRALPTREAHLKKIQAIAANAEVNAD